MIRSLRSRRPRISCVDVLVAADVHQQVHHLLVGATVQRSLERADGAGDGRVHVRKRRGDHARRERGGVHLVVGMQDQRHVEGAGGLLVGPLARQHVQEVRGVAETRIGLDRIQPAAAAVVARHHRRHLRDQPGGLAEVGLLGVRVLVRVVERVGRDGGAQHLHGGCVTSQHVDHGCGLVRQRTGRGQVGRERLQLVARRAGGRAGSGSTSPRSSSARRGRRRRSRRR